jgi:hypothetical protein
LLFVTSVLVSFLIELFGGFRSATNLIAHEISFGIGRRLNL